MGRDGHGLLRFFLLAFCLTGICPIVRADGGAVRRSEQKGGYRITVFTAPTPLRVGPVDVSVFVQDVATGGPVSQARITVRLYPRDRPAETVSRLATAEAATNKLFQAAAFNLSEPGWWDGEIIIEGLPEPVRVRFEMEAAEPLPTSLEWWPWIGWPIPVILLFGLHQWLVRRKGVPR